MVRNIGRYGLVAAGAVLLAGSAAATADGAGGGDSLGRKIDHAIREQGPLITADEQALIRAKCGYRAGEWDGDSIQIDEDGLRCANGRRVNDPQVRAMGKAIGKRVSVYVGKVMKRPDIQAAISGEAQRASEAAMHRFRTETQPQIARAVAAAQAQADRASLDAIRAARAGIDRIDERAIEREVEAALEGVD